MLLVYALVMLFMLCYVDYIILSTTSQATELVTLCSSIFSDLKAKGQQLVINACSSV